MDRASAQVQGGSAAQAAPRPLSCLIRTIFAALLLLSPGAVYSEWIWQGPGDASLQRWWSGCWYYEPNGPYAPKYVLNPEYNNLRQINGLQQWQFWTGQDALNTAYGLDSSNWSTIWEQSFTWSGLSNPGAPPPPPPPPPPPEPSYSGWAAPVAQQIDETAPTILAGFVSFLLAGVAIGGACFGAIKAYQGLKGVK